MMYIIFNHDGSIKEKNLTEFIQQGDNLTKKIAVAIEGIEPAALGIIGTFKLPNNETTVLTSSDTTTIKGTYPGVILALTEAETALAGVVRMNIQAVNPLTEEVYVTYSTFLMINEGDNPGTVAMMSVEAYQNLIAEIAEFVEREETILTFDNRLETIEGYAEDQIIYVKNSSLNQFEQLQNTGSELEWVVIFNFNDYYTKSEVDTLLSGKVDKTTTVNGHALDSNVTISKSDVGLGNVDNKSETTIKSDFTGEIANANTGFVTGGEIYTALSDKVDKVSGSSLVEDTKITAYDNHLINTSNPHLVTATQVGLGNVVNTGDSDTPTSSGITKFTTGGAYTLKNDLQSQITELKGIGRFLSLWDASTGVATTNPPTSPYVYKTGDYFRVSNGGSRMPSGSSYVTGETNYTTSQLTFGVGDLFYYDGTTWQYQTAVGAGGNVIDVQVDGQSVVSSGIANIDLTGKADKVSGATNGDLAGLDSNGNLTDSGIANDDVVTKSGTQTVTGTKTWQNTNPTQSNGYYETTVSSNYIEASRENLEHTVKYRARYSYSDIQLTNIINPNTQNSSQTTYSLGLPKVSATLATNNMIAPTYDNYSTYSVGEYCIYKNVLYKCITAVTTAGTFDSNKWSEIKLANFNPMTTSGDMIVGSSNGAPSRLAKGTDGQILSMVSGNQAWIDNKIKIASYGSLSNTSYDISVPYNSTKNGGVLMLVRLGSQFNSDRTKYSFTSHIWVPKYSYPGDRYFVSPLTCYFSDAPTSTSNTYLFVLHTYTNGTDGTLTVYQRAADGTLTQPSLANQVLTYEILEIDGHDYVY